MELKQLEYFMVTCEKGSFNKAAECLYTTQPNVSKVISSLEKELGRELFERTGKGIRITPYGETVQEYAQNILHNAGLIVSMADHNHGKKFSLATYDLQAVDGFLQRKGTRVCDRTSGRQCGGNQHHGFSGNCGAGNCVCGPEAVTVLSTHPFS